MKRVLKYVWSGFIWLRTRSIVTCEHGNEPSASVYGGECMLAEQTSALKDTADCLLANSRQYLFDICLLQYVQSLTPDDGRKNRPKHVECYSNKISLRH